MKTLILLFFFSLTLSAQSITEPIELTYLNRCLQTKNLQLINKSLTQDQYSFLLKEIILKGILSRENFPKYLTLKSISSKEIPKIFNNAEKNISAYCPLTRFVLNGLKNDYLKDKSKFLRYLPHLSPWLSYFKTASSPEGIKPLYQTLARQIRRRFTLLKGKVDIQSYDQIIYKEIPVQKITPSDMNEELDSLFEVIE